MSDAPTMSAPTKDLLSKVRKLVPPLLEKFHKGQQGRIAVIGGSKDYTGAPFFSANASARLGADLSYVICEPTAAATIKTYSPNLMVSPLLRQSHTLYPGEAPPDAAAVAQSVAAMLARLHVLVLGPGLGRDPLLQDTCRRVLLRAREAGFPCVLDADALQLVNADPATVRGWREVVLTPNVVEFGRLAKAVGVELTGQDEAGECAAVARALDGACVLRKGRVDYVSDGARTWACALEGSRKRSGGQGDTLTGCVGTLLCWRRAYLERLWDVEGGIEERDLVMLAAWGGAAVTRECSRLAFVENGRSMQASDVGDMVPRAFEALIGEEEESKL